MNTGNKNLLQLKLSAENDIDLVDFDFLNHESTFKLVEKIIKGNKVTLVDKIDSRNENANKASAKLTKIFRKEKFIVEERGSNDLFLAYPYIEGKFNDGTLCKAPLLFFPVNLSLSASNKWELKSTEEFFFNKSFLLAFSHYNDTKITDDFLDNSLESLDTTDGVAFLTSLYNYLKNSPITLNFNRELFEQTILFFQNQTRSDLESKSQVGELKLLPNAVLGIFQKADSYLTPDYDELIKNYDFESLENLFESKNVDFNDNIKEESICAAYSIDASQENALIEIKKGNSVVIQGPPGSGKSQLICNLISDFTSKGKKVLVVSQKRVALDVVENRLTENGVANFIANIHDFKNDRKKLFLKIEKQIDEIETYKKTNATLDAIQLEREFITISRKIEAIIEQLDAFKNALFTENLFGISVKELYLTATKKESKLKLESIGEKFDINTLTHFLQKIESFAVYKNQLKNDIYLDRKNYASISNSDKKSLKIIGDELSNFAVKNYSSFFQNPEKNLPELILFAEKELEVLQTDILNFNHEFEHVITHNLSEKIVQNTFKTIYKKLTSEIEINKSKKQIENLLSVALEYLTVSDSFLKGKWWLLSSPNKKILESYLLEFELKINKQNTELIIEKLQNRIDFENYIEELKNTNWCVEFSFEIESFKSVEKTYLDLLIVKNNFDKVFPKSAELYKDFSKIEQVLQLTNSYKQVKNNTLRFYTETQLYSILIDEFDHIIFAEWVNTNLDLIAEIDFITNSFTDLENAIYFQLQNSGIDSLGWKFEVENSIKNYWIETIEEKFPELKMVSTGKIELLEKELKELIQTKWKLSNEIWKIRLMENTYREIKHNRLLNAVTYRELKHQVSKKRSVWPIRKLVATYYEEIFDLMPCWLASPETVSAIFPLVPLFDLVIFDEASQCYAEKGIPSIFRGKQIVIAGDSKQLQPSDLYQIRFEQEEEQAVLEIDSLLDLSKQFLPEKMLTRHYRSESLDLIDFSNHYFYNNNLQLIPNSETLNNYKPAIEYLKVNGVWKNNSNEVEAEKIVSLVFGLLAKGEKNIGIVTFNYHQQSLIQDLLDKNTGDYPLPEQIFVKNIENIQGDERDIIIFSLGYAADSEGRFVSQFGSLNQVNGENRLNVAVTRARKKIILVASIMPSELTVQNSLNEGPKYLKKYLEYALKVSNGEYNVNLSENTTLKNKALLITKLIQNNTKIHSELPFSDLVEKEKNLYQKLVFTDDNRLYNSTTKDFFAYLPLAVSKMNWTYRREFSRNYFGKK